MDNNNCLKNGGDFCKFNYEKHRSFQITVRSTDNGNPALSTNVALTITLADVNDQPRGLRLGGNTVKENATKGEIIGKFSAEDEDHGQNVTYYLSDDDHGRFAVSSDGYLTKVLSINYEKNKTHTVTAVAKDNGTPMMKVGVSDSDHLIEGCPKRGAELKRATFFDNTHANRRSIALLIGYNVSIHFRLASV